MHTLTENNPVITIPQDQLIAQAASLGTPVSTALNDPSFAEVAPLGLVTPEEVIPGSGEVTMVTTITSLYLLSFSFCVFVI